MSWPILACSRSISALVFRALNAPSSRWAGVSTEKWVSSDMGEVPCDASADSDGAKNHSWHALIGKKDPRGEKGLAGRPGPHGRPRGLQYGVRHTRFRHIFFINFFVVGKIIETAG